MDLMEIQEDLMEEKRKQSMHILLLNEYCLLEIFEYLKIEEVFRMEKVCTRFQEISQRIYLTTRKLYIYELCEANLPVSEVTQIIRRVGPYIHTLSVRECSVTLKKGEIPRFTRFREDVLHLKVEEGEDETILFQSLKDVDLIHCEVADGELSYLPLEQLEELYIYHTDIKGEILKNLKNINELNLTGMDPLDSDVFKEFCEATPNLRSLNLHWTDIDSDDLNVIATSLKNLETLTLSNCYDDALQEDFDVIADLPKLKNLELLEIVEEDDAEELIDLRQFLLLVSHHNRLETLKYALHLDEVDSSTITRALANLTNLKEFIIDVLTENSQFLDDVLESFTAKHKLEKLFIATLKITSQAIEMFIKRCPRIRLIDMTLRYYLEIDLLDFLNNIHDCLSQRSHVLKIRMPKAQQKKCEDLINGSSIKNLKLIFK